MPEISDLISLIDEKKALKALKKQGYFFIENACSPNYCAQAIDLINHDAAIKKDTADMAIQAEKHYGNSELRLWDRHKTHDLLNQFTVASDALVSFLLRKKTEAMKLLAIKNMPLHTEGPEFIHGRWHTDSFFNQLKVFLFLSETSEVSGPFEFLKNTHTPWFKMRHISHYFDFSNLLRKTNIRKYQRFDDNWLKTLEQKNYPSTPVICPAGTLLVVDTSAIHRARPCLKEERYALTVYYDTY